MSAIVAQLRAQDWKSVSEGRAITDEDVARMSPLGHAHINVLGRYDIAPSGPSQGLRSLRSPADGPDDED